MSRSYKLAIEKCCPDDGTWFKRQANKRVRRTKDISDGSAYKRVYCSWNIHDYISDGRFDSDWLGYYIDSGKGFKVSK